MTTETDEESQEEEEEINKRTLEELKQVQVNKAKTITYHQDRKMLVIEQSKYPPAKEELYTVFGSLPEDISVENLNPTAITIFGVHTLEFGSFGEDANEVLSHADSFNVSPIKTRVKFTPRSDHLNPFIQFEYKSGSETTPATISATVTYENIEEHETAHNENRD